jgi:hypothetical protein
MSRASISYRAHVPCRGSLGIDREPVAVRICARLRWRAHSGIKNAQTPPAIQSTPVTSFERAIAAFLPLRRRLREPVELRGPSRLRAPALFSSHEGPLRLICNFLGAFKALRSLSSNALVQDCRQAASSIFNTFSLSPAFLSAPVHHGNNHDSRSVGNAQIPSGEIRNVVR